MPKPTLKKHIHVSLQFKKVNVCANRDNYPLECTFSNMEIASIAIHATISMDILE